MAQTQKVNKFTPEEEARIQAQIKEMQEKQRQAEIEAEARNRLLDEQRKQPGYKYY